MLMNYGEQGQSNPIFGPEGADILRLDSVSCDSLPAYFNGLDHRLNLSGQSLGVLTTAASLMESYDVVLERTDPRHQAANSFLRGCALAVRVASEMLPAGSIAHLGEASFNDVYFTDDADEVTRRSEYSQLITRVSNEGYHLASAYHSLLDDWIDELNSNISLQTETRLGFGFVFYLIHDYLERSARDDMTAMEELLDEGAIDWDEEFAELDLGE